ncbi:hypothetical protein ACFFU1_18300 [Algibacter miyuki]|uniref:Uncharacterized protein n=1 Tax=Algibacter miyuki TaxID=1306933 RepID=A0ABV5H4P0_9FLAO|nr:hypothetical protein [Algibacter miyuki]MDN3665794.1 hypothetical protein [Algibacter miyuki]
MSETPLEHFFMGLIPNLWEVLLFFIPDKNFTKEIKDALYVKGIGKITGKILVMDTTQGPMPYKTGRDNKYALFKASKLERNLYKLLEERNNGELSNFNYILDKYYEQVECIFYITDWMNRNIKQVSNTDNTVKGLFEIQTVYYKKHLETFIKHFYPNRQAVPQGKFDVLGKIQTYFPDISKQYIKPLDNTDNNNCD